MFASCTGELSAPNLDEDGSYGSVEIVSPRAIDGELLQYASATVTGQGISEIIKVEDIKITDGKGSFVIDKIPSGKNRIVTVQAYQATGSKLLVSGMTLRAVFDITKGETTKISCNWETTALGNVYSSLLTKGFDISTLSTQTVSELIDESVHSALINCEKIATDIISGSTKEKSSYVLKPASLNVTVNETSSFQVQVCDPLSSVTDGSGTSVKVSNIAPGVWPVYLFDENGERQKSQTVSFSSGNEAQVSFATVTDKIIIHLETSSPYKNIYAWTDAPKVEPFGTWPGKAMEDTNGDGWYDTTIEYTSINLIFNGSGQTGDLSRSAGEWWYTDGNWTSYNPNDEVPPVIQSFSADKPGTISGILTLTVSANDNIGVKTAEFSVDGTKVGSASFDTLSGTAEFELDTELYSNAAHSISVVVSDVSGNKSEEKTLEFTFQNENPAPVAVITGSKNVGKGVEKVYSASSSKDKNGTVEGYSWTVTGATIISGSDTKEITVKTPDSEGKFTVSLVVKDNEGKSSESVSIEVTVKDKVSNDFREESIYFLMTARFYDGDSSNNRWCRSDDSSGNRANNDYPWRGDFKGLIEKLDYIKALGFSAIWITPPVLNRSDFDFHGYHAWNMNKIDPRLESTGATYQDLINECHKRGMKVIQDIVLNHSSRYGLEDLFVPKHYGSKSITWDNGKGIGAEYYDDFNPKFTYNGLDAEPNSGKTFYNGDLWQEEKPTNLWWNPDLSDWGVLNQQYNYYLCQWPTLKLFDPNYFHQTWLGNWEDESCQSGTIHEDCIDLNTESAAVQKYLIDAYTKYIEMGVDAFRVDTVKHVSRLMFNRHFIPAFKEAGGENFYMFGEVCTRVNEVWNHGVPPLSTPFYTWKERKTYSADDSSAVHEAYKYENGQGVGNQPTSDNHALIGNEYHKPDYSQKSGLDVIDFPMHWNFDNAGQAYNKRGDDKYYNDATWNVVYVDSHDYGPNMDNRYGGGTEAWAENMTYMWTFRGIPCLYYGSEIEFKAGAPCDKGPSAPLESTGRAYYGGHIEGSVTTTDFGEWSNATGEMKTTLESPLSKHLSHLNKIRRAIPALQKGQYSNEGCDGTMAFKRRFTDDSTDSFVLVTVSGSATFTGLPEGTYIDVVTGDEKIIEEGGTIEADCSGKANARIYVLTTTKTKAPGKISGSSPYLK